MRVQLAVPWTDGGVAHRAGSKVQVTPDVGRQLILDGFASAVGVVEEVDEEDAPETTPEPDVKASAQPATTAQKYQGITEKGAGHGGSQL